MVKHSHTGLVTHFGCQFACQLGCQFGWQVGLAVRPAFPKRVALLPSNYLVGS
jgi:hypothetical protein